MKKISSILVFSILLFYSINVSSDQLPVNSATQALLTVVPNAYVSTGGTATFLGPMANSQRTYQWLIHEDQLTALVGHEISGFSMRIPTSATSDWPASDVTYTNYDIYLSGSVPPASRSLVFAENIVGTQVQVRTGSLLIPANSYHSGGSPNDFGPEVTFNTPYIYSGGHLLIELRHTGFSGTSRSNDAISTTTSGYGSQFSACWTGNYAGTQGSQGNFSVIRLNSSPATGIGNSNEIPLEFKLSQNFPNPFNPSTVINFSIPKNEFVSLKVYDQLGREVKTLVNEIKSPGNYSINFSSENFSSGVYFYTITAGSFTDTKKMTVIK